MTSTLAGIFNNQLLAFLNDVESVLPKEEAASVRKAYRALNILVKFNTSKPIKTWSKYSSKYDKEISSGDIDAFINHDYSSIANQESDENADSGAWFDAIEQIRICARKLDTDSQMKTMQYIQNLQRLANAYNQGR